LYLLCVAAENQNTRVMYSRLSHTVSFCRSVGTRLGAVLAVLALTSAGAADRVRADQSPAGVRGDSSSVRLPAANVPSAALVQALADASPASDTTASSFIDEPFIQQAVLPGVGETVTEELGWGLALSANGDTAVVTNSSFGSGAPGTAWIFVRSGTTWSQQGSALTNGTAQNGFGISVAMSADGDTVLIGGYGEKEYEGAAWIYVRRGSTWTEQAEIVGSDEEYNSRFGRSVALSADGNTALVGGIGDNSYQGAAWVFERSDSSWTQDGPKLTGTTAFSEFGNSVALSADGATAVVGAPAEGPLGAVWVFDRTGPGWVYESRLVGADQEGWAKFGSSVSISGDGETLLIGGLEDDEGAGAAWVFDRSGSEWYQRNPKFTGIGEDGPSEFGASLALSFDGDSAIVGGYSGYNAQGAAWVFRRVAGTWHEQEQLHAQEAYRFVEFGTNVALSADGNTALIGAPRATWLFTHPMPAVTTGSVATVTPSGASINLFVNPNGAPVGDCGVEYGLTAAYGLSMPCTGSAGSGKSPVALATMINGLSENTLYHFRAFASSAAGRGYGNDDVLLTLSGPPSVMTDYASDITSHYATLNGALNPHRAAVASCRFEFGRTLAYGSDVACPATEPQEASTAVSAVVPVLANGDYHFRIVVTTEGGTSYGQDQVFHVPHLPFPRIEARLTWRFGWSRNYTLVRSLVVHSIPAGAHVEVACYGHGCPFPATRTVASLVRTRCHGRRSCGKQPVRRAQSVNIGAIFKDRHLAVRARIVVSVLRSGWIGKEFAFRMRANREPASKISCVYPQSPGPREAC